MAVVKTMLSNNGSSGSANMAVKPQGKGVKNVVKIHQKRRLHFFKPAAQIYTLASFNSKPYLYVTHTHTHTLSPTHNVSYLTELTLWMTRHNQVTGRSTTVQGQRQNRVVRVDIRRSVYIKLGFVQNRPRYGGKIGRHIMEVLKLLMVELLGPGLNISYLAN